MAATFYRWFSERQRELTRFGRGRRERTERSRLGLLMRHAVPPGDFLEIGPGHGTLAERAVAATWRYRAMEASPVLIDELRRKGLEVVQGYAPPILAMDASTDVLYADQVLEHMSGIDAAREFVAEAWRVLRPGGIFFAVVPDYLTERGFFWDVDYTHNFVTTERRVKQLLYDGGFDLRTVVRSIGAATGVRRDLLAAGKLFTGIPGLDTLSRYAGAESLLFRVRKNLFETLEFVAQKPDR
ncbi:MAG: class I SAM-dependent methyltransferase [Vicinamibacterales bacterium]